MPLNINFILHVPFETPGCIEKWCKQNNHNTSFTRLYNNEPLPSFESFDWIVIMGGPMGIYDDKDYSWLKLERSFIKEAINANKVVLGICLGSQFIADALGAKVYKNKVDEIGWFNIEKNQESNHPIINNLPELFPVFHWHGDTFDLPEGALHLFSSEATINQAFIYNNKVLALQFHMEITPELLNGMMDNVNANLTEKEYIQTKKEILSQIEISELTNKFMFSILDKMAII